MRVGYHLPQFGRAAVPGAIQRAAARAEELGFDDVWVSDHLVIPASQPYPAPYLYDPLMALAFAAAGTSRIGLGTSVLVATHYPSPLALANSLASLDNLSGGRLVLGVGIGWSQPEYEALGAAFDHRGARLEEILDLWEATWRDDPASHQGRYYPSFTDIRLLPKPGRPIPVWLGGSSDAALERAIARADGYQGLGLEPEAAADTVKRIRAVRPEETFTISLRVGWDPRVGRDDLRAKVGAYQEAGVQHLHFAPDRGDLDTWLAGMDTLAGHLDPAV